jgi:predicted DNA-binding antitoxin AbrB/MazE fold protein
MSQRVDAIFENGAFYPEVPLGIPSGSRVVLDITTKPVATDDDLSDVQDLLDHEFIESCRKNGTQAASLDEAQKILSKFTGSLSGYISEDRDEH